MKSGTEIAALQADPGLQLKAQQGLDSALADWQTRPRAAAVRAEFTRFAADCDLAEVGPLAELFGCNRAEAARIIIAPLIAAWTAALVEQPFGIAPLRHLANSASSSLLLAAEQRAAIRPMARNQSCSRRTAAIASCLPTSGRGRTDPILLASGISTFLYDMAHDHNFHFLTLGYFGPGYWSDYYEFDYSEVSGFAGEPVNLIPKGRQRLELGKLMLFHAHHDVHRQLPADTVSVSINVMHTNPIMGWLDQYRFDVEAGTIGGIVNSGPTEAFLRIAVAMSTDEALDMAERFAATHPSERMRMTAFGALASAQKDDAARDGVWARAEGSGSRMVALEAKARRLALVD